MGKKGLKIIQGQTKEGRKQLRKSLGTLKSLTVQPRTKVRYAEGLEEFFTYLEKEGLVLPTKRQEMDAVVGDYFGVKGKAELKLATSWQPFRILTQSCGGTYLCHGD